MNFSKFREKVGELKETMAYFGATHKVWRPSRVHLIEPKRQEHKYYKSLLAAHKMRIERSDAPSPWWWCCILILVVISLAKPTDALDNYNDDLTFDATKESISLVLPHDTYPGFNIQRMSSLSSLLNATSSSTLQTSSYTLNRKYAKYFTVLDNGMLMTTSDLTPLVNQPVNLVVLEETPNATIKHQLQLFVMNRKDMIHFPTATLEVNGEVLENQPAGTVVQGVPLLQANSLGGHKAITYAIVEGNEEQAFTLQNSHTKEMKPSMSIRHGEKAGVWLVTNRPLDRETKNQYSLLIEATDNEGLDKALSRVIINVNDLNVSVIITFASLTDEARRSRNSICLSISPFFSSPLFYSSI